MDLNLSTLGQEKKGTIRQFAILYRFQTTLTRVFLRGWLCACASRGTDKYTEPKHSFVRILMFPLIQIKI